MTALTAQERRELFVQGAGAEDVLERALRRAHQEAEIRLDHNITIRHVPDVTACHHCPGEAAACEGCPLD